MALQARTETEVQQVITASILRLYRCTVINDLLELKPEPFSEPCLKTFTN